MLAGMGQAEAATTGKTEAVVLPWWYRCARCGYPSGASGSVVCPECGCAVTRETLDADQRRLDEVDSWGGVRGGRWLGSGMQKAVRRWIAAIAFITVGMTAMTRSIGVFGIVPLVLLAAVGMSWSFGWVVARLKPKEARAYTQMMWGRQLWRLHLPWLCAPVYMVAAFILGPVDMLFDLGGWLYWAVPPLAWALWCLDVFRTWWKRYFVRGVGAIPGRCRCGLSEVAAVVLGGGTMLTSCAMGLVVGLFVMAHVAMWLGVDPGLLGVLAVFAYGSRL